MERCEQVRGRRKDGEEEGNMTHKKHAQMQRLARYLHLSPLPPRHKSDQMFTAAGRRPCAPAGVR